MGMQSYGPTNMAMVMENFRRIAAKKAYDARTKDIISAGLRNGLSSQWLSENTELIRDEIESIRRECSFYLLAVNRASKRCAAIQIFHGQELGWLEGLTEKLVREGMYKNVCFYTVSDLEENGRYSPYELVNSPADYVSVLETLALEKGMGEDSV